MTARTLDNASLRRCVLFDRLDDDALARIAGLVKWRTYRRGTDVFRFQDESTDIYLIASGRVRVTVFSYSGKEITYQELGEGDIFGELSAIDQRPRTANVITL
ncbi:MAG: cyclic nucleotide-binding domain-containing protein, partial [Proteobacteria bacterium]